MIKFLLDIFFFIFLCLFQITLFNHIYFLGHINPYIYILFVINYPVHSNKFNLLFLSFLLGWSIDHFMNSGGVHAFSLTFIAYVRIYILRFISGKYALSHRDFSIYKLSFAKQFSTIFIVVLLHNQILFFIDFIENSKLEKNLFNMVISFFLQIFFCVTYLFFFKKK